MNKMMKKGLISVAAATLMASNVFAATSVNTYATTTMFNAGGDYNVTTTDINISETLISGVPVSGGTVNLTVTVPGSLQLSGKGATGSGADINTSEIVSGTAYLFLATVSGARLDGDNANADANTSVWIDINGSDSSTYLGSAVDSNASLGMYKLFDLYQNGKYGNSPAVLSMDSNSSTFKLLSLSGSDIDLNNTMSSINADNIIGQLTATSGDMNLTKLALVTVGSDNSISFSLNLKPMSDSTVDLINLRGLGLRNAVTGGTGSAALNFVGTGGISTHSVTAATLQANAATLELNTSSVVNVNAATTTGQVFTDFNVTFPSNYSTGSDDGNITLKLTNATWASNSYGITLANSAESLITNSMSGGAAAGDDNSTLILHLTDVNMTANTQVSIGGRLTVTGTAGSAVTVDFHTSGNDGNYSSLNTYAATSTPLTIANIVNDGVSSTATGTTAIAVIGGLSQSGTDINITESFDTSFATNKTLTLTLPTGYTWATRPSIYSYTYGAGDANRDDNQSSVVADTSSNVYTVTFSTDLAESTVKAYTDIALRETLDIDNIKFNVPSTAVNDETVTITLGGTALDSKTVTGSPITIATVKSTTATLTDLTSISETTGTKVGLASATTAGTGSTTTGTVTSGSGFFVNEAFAGTLQAGKTISATLDSGSFLATTAITSPVRLGSPITVGSPVGSDSNKTLTWTVTAASSANDQNTTIYLPSVYMGATNTAAATPTVTIGGTAGVTGTVKPAEFVSAVTTATSGLPALAASNVDVATAVYTVTETLKSGVSAGSFRVIAPKGISFTGKYYAGYKLTTATSYTDAFSSTDKLSVADANKTTTFNTNDTLSVEMPTAAISSSINDVKFYFIVNVDPTATDGLKTFTVKSGAGISDENNINLAYVGTIPTLTAAADATVAAAGTTSVVPTNATGTVTYASADTAIATVDAAGTVTVDANATAAATVVITATDSLTAQAASTTITVGTPAPVLLSGDITLAAGWNFVSAPFDGSIDIATIVAAGCSQVHLADTTTGFWGAAATTGTATPGQGVAAYCAAAGTASYTGVTPAATPFSMATNITGTGSTGVPSTHAAYAVGANFKVVGTPTATTFADVITAGASGVMYYNGTAFDLSSDYTSAGFTGVADNAAQTIPAGASFYIQTK